MEHVDLSEAWIEGDERARWSSATGPAGASSGTSVLEVPVGCRLPRHTDSAEETVVVVDGTADVHVGGDVHRVRAGGASVVPACAPHEVHNAGDRPLRFLAVYASADVVTRYEDDVQPDGSRERRPVA